MQTPGNPISTVPRRALRALAGIFMPLALAAGALAEQPPSKLLQPSAVQKPADAAGHKAAREHELEAIRAEQKQAAEIEARLRKEVEALGEDRRKLNEALIATAARVRSDEERIGAAETRLRTLEAGEGNLRTSLAARRAVIVEILATLQRMGRRPPPAILVSPKELIAKLEQDVALSARAASAAARAQESRANLATLKDPGRLAPAVAFASAKGVLPLPVNGVRIRDFGTSDRLGGTEKGLWIA